MQKRGRGRSQRRFVQNTKGGRVLFAFSVANSMLKKSQRKDERKSWLGYSFLILHATYLPISNTLNTMAAKSAAIAQSISSGA
jgi:hypothetical protein